MTDTKDFTCLCGGPRTRSPPQASRTFCSAQSSASNRSFSRSPTLPSASHSSVIRKVPLQLREDGQGTLLPGSAPAFAPARRGVA